MTKTNWQNMKLGDVVELKRGYDLPTRQRRTGSVPIVSSAGTTGWHDEAKVRAPGVVVGRYGTLGQVFLVEQDFWPLNTTLYVRNFKGNDPRFISHFLRTIDYYSYSDKAAVPGVNRNHLHLAQVLVPPLDIQRAIADILGSLDDKIELNRRMNQTLEGMARAIFKSWFIDFDPVRAKVDGNPPPGLDPATAALFPNAFQNSPLGPIPQGWEVKTLPEIIDVNPRRTLKKGSVAPYLDMGNMPTASARANQWYDREFKSGTKFINGDVLVARITPCLENGKTAFVDFLADRQVAWGSTEYIVLRSKAPLPLEYTYFLARSEPFRTHAIVNMTGSSGRQRVPASCLSNLNIVVPPGTVAERFGDFARDAVLSMKQYDEESNTLRMMRDALLPKLLSGELPVGEAEQLAGEVA